MMSDPSAEDLARVTSLTVENFRGLRSPVSLDLDASAVLLCGANGTGKTSVFDAFQWLLIGDVPRLAGYTMRRNEEYLVNTYDLNRPARVDAEFRLVEHTLRATRVGNSRGSSLEVAVAGQRHVGDDAERILESSLVHGELSLREVLATSGLLQQDDLRQLLQTKPDERYRQLLRLLGLEVLERFDRFAAANRDRARADAREARNALDRLRGELTEQRERLDTARVQVERTAAQELDTRDVAASVERHTDVLRLSAVPSESQELAALGASARSTADQIRRELARLADLPQSLTEDLRPVLEQATTARVAAEAALDGARQRRGEAQQSLRAAASVQDALGRLAAAALPLLPLNEDTAPCPVCQTPIHPQQVADDLGARAASAAALAAAQTVVESADDEVRRAEDDVAHHRSDESALSARMAERRDVVASLRRALAALTQIQGNPPSPLQIPIELGVGGEPQLSPGADVNDAGKSNDFDGQLFAAWVMERSKRLAALEQLVAGMEALADTADSAASAGTAVRLAAERSAALPRQQARFSELQARLTAQEDAYEDARRAETTATALAQGATAAATDLSRERLAGLAPLMNDIYSRLDPHPAFTRLGFQVDTYRARGTATANVTDVEERRDANPMLVFSSAQANAVVLAVFLALGWAAGDQGLPFVLLDDPLQSLDDVNVLGFADLARRLRRQRQIVLATHEERFASLLERKLTGRSDGEKLIVHRFLGWSRSGPTIESRRVSARPDLQLRVLAS